MAVTVTSLALLQVAYAIVSVARPGLNVSSSAVLVGFVAAFGAAHLAVARRFGEIDVSLYPSRARLRVTPGAARQLLP
jgi:hypothetical protein